MSPENYNIEWKSSWRDEYLKWICGFANAHGGLLEIGIRDDGSVCGVKNAPRLMEDISNKIRETLKIVADVRLRHEGDADIIDIHVPASFAPVWFRDAIYMRSGNTNQRLHDVSLMHFLINKTGTKWDSITMEGVSIDDLDPQAFKVFRRDAARSKRLEPEDINLPNPELLTHLGLMVKGRLTRAAVLLFHENPELFFMGAWLKIGYFDSREEVLYQDELHGPLILQAARVLDLIYTKYLKAVISYEGIHRIETYPYSREVLREAIFNAIIHKDYTAGYPIQISVYEDKFLVLNPAVLNYDWTSAEAWEKYGSRPLNPAIANTFFRAGYAEAWGQGIRKMSLNAAKHGMPSPSYSINTSSVLVCATPLSAQSSGPTLADLSDKQKLFLDYIRLHPEATYQEIADAIGTSARTIASYTKKFVEMQVIARDDKSRRSGFTFLQ